uniref:Uncharacterized protein n=1 Tax=Arundo donax TaxID=35708 RepID=A0A0A9HSN2_ARUDO
MTSHGPHLKYILYSSQNMSRDKMVFYLMVKLMAMAQRGSVLQATPSVSKYLSLFTFSIRLLTIHLIQKFNANKKI